MKKAICLLLIALFCFSVPVYAIEDDEDEENNENKIVMVYIFNKEDESISASAIDYLKELKKSEIGKYFDYRVLTVWDKNWMPELLDIPQTLGFKLRRYYNTNPRSLGE